MTTIVGLQNQRWIVDGEYDALHGLDGLVSHGWSRNAMDGKLT